MFGLKVALGVLMLLAILSAEVLLVRLLARLRGALKPLMHQGCENFMGRHKRRSRPDAMFERAYEDGSQPSALYTVIGMFCVDVYAVYVAAHTKSPEAWIGAHLMIAAAAVGSLLCVRVGGKSLQW